MKKTKLASAEIPETYAELCRMLPPRKIADKSDYANVMEVRFQVPDVAGLHGAALQNLHIESGPERLDGSL